MTTSNEIISRHEAAILESVREAGGADVPQPGVALTVAIHNAAFYRAMADLIERELLTAVKHKPPGSARWCTHVTITPLGRRALAGDKARCAAMNAPGRVLPNTRNRMAGFHRVRPMAGVYFRNDGNTDRPSRGVAC